MAVMAKFDIAERTVVKLKKEGPKIIEEAERNSLTLNTKTVRQARYPIIDDEVLRLVHLARSVKFNLTLDMITRRALLVKALILGNPNLKKAQRAHLESFSASKGWAVNFTRRYGLRTAPQGDSIMNNAAASMTAEAMTNLQKRLALFHAKHIYSVDETALFFKVMPRVSYVHSHQDGHAALNDKVSLSVNDRITAYVCSNADGSERVPLSVIGKARHSLCFKTGPIPNGMTYFSNESACSNANSFRAWFKNVFVSFIRSRTSEKVVLLVDLPNSYGTLKDEKGQVQLISFTQPPELDISVTWKREYRKRLLRAILIDVEVREELRKANSVNAPGINGLAEGYPPHVLDFMRLSKDAWESISQTKIARCWRSANILPPRINAEIEHVIGGTGVEFNMESDLNVFMTMHKKLTQHLKVEDPMYCTELAQEHIERWLNMEYTNEVSSALIESSLSDMKPLSVKAESDTNEVVQDGNSSDVEMTPAEIPSLEQLYDAFRPAQRLAYSCHLPDANNHLNHALELIRTAISKQKDSSKTQVKVDTPKENVKEGKPNAMNTENEVSNMGKPQAMATEKQVAPNVENVEVLSVDKREAANMEKKEELSINLTNGTSAT